MSYRRPRYDRDDDERDRRAPLDRDDEQSFPPEEPDRRRMQGERSAHVRRTAQDAVRRASDRGGSGPNRLSRSAKKRAILITAIVGGLAVVAIVAFALFSGSRETSVRQPTASQPANSNAQAPATGRTQTTTPQAGRETDSGLPIPGLSEPASPATTATTADEPWFETALRILLKLALAALLAAMLAFRPRKDMPVMQRNPYVAQTQILLAVVGAAMMMVVGDNAARAFGIFAAASLVRFRTNIRDPKEITVLLVSLGIGLAAGVGRIEVAILLSLFVLLMLWVLEYYEPAQVFRAMELTVTTRNVTETDEILREIFDKRSISAELREVDREDKDDPVGKIVYYVNVSPTVSTDQLSEEVFSSDPDNIDSIQWDQKKSTSYIYR